MSEALRRGSSRTATAVGGLAGGLIGGLTAAVLSFAIGAMRCERCGPIPKKEFPPDDRTEMRVGCFAILSVTAMTLVGAVYLPWLQGN